MVCPNLLHICVLSVCLMTFLPAPSRADDLHLQKRQVDTYEQIDQSQLDAKPKRPFCNAFTGCGKKRSDDSMGSLLELNSEPAVVELSRQILSEAKMWEAIQEARAELLRRRQSAQQHPSIPLDRPLALAAYRKKRSLNIVPADIAQMDLSTSR